MDTPAPPPTKTGPSLLDLAALGVVGGKSAPAGGGAKGNNAIDNPFAAITNAVMQTCYGMMQRASEEAYKMEVNILSMFFGKQAMA